MDSIEITVEFMKRHSLLLTTAESCTAGLIASTLAELPGAGSLLDCAFVVYSPDAKQQCLDVDASTIETYGLTSEHVAREMAVGALSGSRANVAIANTGVADDVGDGIPVGTQCFAWAFRDRHAPGGMVVFTETRRFGGTRNCIRRTAAAYALKRIPVYWQRVMAAHEPELAHACVSPPSVAMPFISASAAAG